MSDNPIFESSTDDTLSSSIDDYSVNSSSCDSIEPISKENNLCFSRYSFILIVVLFFSVFCVCIISVMFYFPSFSIFFGDSRVNDRYQSFKSFQEPISKFGTEERDYVCRGNCYCSDVDKRRTVIAQNAFFVATAVVSAVSLIYAANNFKSSKGLEMCKQSYSNECDVEKIFFDEDSVACLALNNIENLDVLLEEMSEGENLDWKEKKREFHREFLCKGHCLMNPVLPPEISAHYEDIDCEGRIFEKKITIDINVVGPNLVRRDEVLELMAKVKFNIEWLEEFCRGNLKFLDTTKENPKRGGRYTFKNVIKDLKREMKGKSEIDVCISSDFYYPDYSNMECIWATSNMD